MAFNGSPVLAKPYLSPYRIKKTPKELQQSMMLLRPLPLSSAFLMWNLVLGPQLAGKQWDPVEALDVSEEPTTVSGRDTEPRTNNDA